MTYSLFPSSHQLLLKINSLSAVNSCLWWRPHETPTNITVGVIIVQVMFPQSHYCESIGVDSLWHLEDIHVPDFLVLCLLKSSHLIFCNKLSSLASLCKKKKNHDINQPPSQNCSCCYKTSCPNQVKEESIYLVYIFILLFIIKGSKNRTQTEHNPKAGPEA